MVRVGLNPRRSTCLKKAISWRFLRASACSAFRRRSLSRLKSDDAASFSSSDCDCDCGCGCDCDCDCDCDYDCDCDCDCYCYCY